MKLFEWSKEIKNEIKSAVSASIETNKEVARLQERVKNATSAFDKSLQSFETLLRQQAEQLQTLRDRVAALEAQQSALHNNAMVLAAQYAKSNDAPRPKALLPLSQNSGDRRKCITMGSTGGLGAVGPEVKLLSSPPVIPSVRPFGIAHPKPT
jgi:septal ring factor EnvC (AmiA/AmiB activator)